MFIILLILPYDLYGDSFLNFFKRIAQKSSDIKSQMLYIEKSNINVAMDESKYHPIFKMKAIYSGNNRETLSSSQANRDGVLTQDRTVTRRLGLGAQLDMNFQSIDLYKEKQNPEPMPKTNEQGVNTVGQTPSSSNKESESSARLSITQPLWQNSFGSTWRRESQLAAEQDHMDRMSAYLKIESWYELMIAKFFIIARKYMDVKDAEKKIYYAKRILDTAKNRHKYGDLRDKELYDAEADYISSLVSLNTKRHEFNDEINKFIKKYRIARSEIIKVLQKSNIIANSSILGKDTCKQFNEVEQNVELARMKKIIEINSLRIGIAKDNSRPKLDLIIAAETVGVGENKSDAFSKMDRGVPTYEVGLVLSVPLGSNIYDHEERKLVRDKYDESSNYDSRFSEFEAEYDSYCKTKKLNMSNLGLKKRGVELTKNKFNLSMKDFELGNITSSELSREANDLMHQESSYFYSMIDISQAYFQILLLEGKVGSLL